VQQFVAAVCSSWGGLAGWHSSSSSRPAAVKAPAVGDWLGGAAVVQQCAADGGLVCSSRGMPGWLVQQWPSCLWRMWQGAAAGFSSCAFCCRL
jgi:hypothetical protein